MVALAAVEASNARIASALPPGLVAVFVGATNGIGETALRQFAKHARRPRVYFVGRSQEAGDRIAAECQALNGDGAFVFIQADTSLLRNVDDICRDIGTKETAINLLFLSTGTLVMGVKTAEGLDLAMSLAILSRNRFIVNLLPQLQKATALRRVVSVMAATKEGPVNTDNLAGSNLSLLARRGHGASMATLSLEHLAATAPSVSFIHNFPGVVKSGILRGTHGGMMLVFKTVIRVFGPLLFIPLVEVGDRHVFLATSARYPARADAAGAAAEAAAGVPLADGVVVARGTDATPGSGVYSVDEHGESAGPKVEALLAGLRRDGVVEKAWQYVEGEFVRVTGRAAAAAA